MTLFKRHIGRRVAGVGVAAALVVLGLEAPAFAEQPTISSFSPSSGPAGCVFVITGTNFNNPNVDKVDIGGTDVANFEIISGTEIWATVAAATTSGTLHVRNASGTANSATNFTVANPGGCAPTITSIAPTCGSAGATVTITGTNLLSGSDPSLPAQETEVRFADYTADAVHTIPNAESPTQLSVLVPSGAKDGPIRVTTFAGPPAGEVFSATRFDVPPPDCPGAPTITSFAPTQGPVGTTVVITGTNFTGTTAVTFNGVTATFTVDSATQITATVPTGATTGKIAVTNSSGTATSASDFTVGEALTHERSVTLRLRKHLVARGAVSVGDGFTACRASVPVKIQRRVSGQWKTVGRATTTSTGSYKKAIRDRVGRYRALAPKVELSGGDICLPDRSPAARHTH